MKTKQLSVDGDLDSFLSQVRTLWPAAKGSVAEVRKPCTRPGCRACAEGRKHRAVILSFKDGDRRRCMYVSAELAGTLRRAIASGRRIEQLLSEAGAQLVRGYRRSRKGRETLRSGETEA